MSSIRYPCSVGFRLGSYLRSDHILLVNPSTTCKPNGLDYFQSTTRILRQKLFQESIKTTCLFGLLVPVPYLFLDMNAKTFTLGSWQTQAQWTYRLYTCNPVPSEVTLHLVTPDETDLTCSQVRKWDNFILLNLYKGIRSFKYRCRRECLRDLNFVLVTVKTL